MSSSLLDLQLGTVRRGSRARTALLALNGARAAEVKRALTLAQNWDPRPLSVAVDGGLRSLQAARLRAELFVGDADSVRGRPAAIERVEYDRLKDFSDLAGALCEIERRGARVVVVAGLLGGRLDHEWINLQELGLRARGFAGVVAPTDRGLVVVTAAGFRARTASDRTVSLLVLGGAATVSLSGTRWTLQRRRLRPGSLGLSNRTGRRLLLVVHAGVVALIFPDEHSRWTTPSRTRKRSPGSRG